MRSLTSAIKLYSNISLCRGVWESELSEGRGTGNSLGAFPRLFRALQVHILTNVLD